MNPHTRRILFASLMTVAMATVGCNKLPPASPILPAASAPAGNVSDIDVTEHVKTALQQNESLRGFNISVVTLKGDVRLIGVVDNQTQVDEAIKIARASAGAHSIHDELSIKK